jgi:predicted nucleic acid-binding Zn ribbon protein
VVQRMSDDPLEACTVCGAPVQRVFHPVAVHFKGSGFYNTDYGTAKRNRQSAASADSGADKHDAKQADKKSDSSTSSDTSSSSTTSSPAKSDA